jgi:hypothetical protein
MSYLAKKESLAERAYTKHKNSPICLQPLYYNEDLERQEDERAHRSTKQQVTTVTSSRECVDGQLQNSRQKSKKNSPEIVRPKRDGSPTCVSRFSPCGVNGKEACHTTQELVQDKNMVRQRAFVENMDRHRAFVPSH